MYFQILIVSSPALFPCICLSFYINRKAVDLSELGSLFTSSYNFISVCGNHKLTSSQCFLDFRHYPTVNWHKAQRRVLSFTFTVEVFPSSLTPTLSILTCDCPQHNAVLWPSANLLMQSEGGRNV